MDELKICLAAGMASVMMIIVMIDFSCLQHDLSMFHRVEGLFFMMQQSVVP